MTIPEVIRASQILQQWVADSLTGEERGLEHYSDNDKEEMRFFAKMLMKVEDVGKAYLKKRQH